MSRKNKKSKATAEQLTESQKTESATKTTLSAKKDWYALLGAMVLAAILIFMGLGKHYFWDDEANTAIVGRNMVKTWSASAWDGRNLLSYGLRGSVDADMKKSSVPPVQYIVAGIGQNIFGTSTGQCRFIFALFGWLAILLATLWYKEEFGQKRWWLPAYVLALSVAYILYVRQVRYYPLCLFFSFALLYLWSYLPKAKHPWLISSLALVSGGLLAGTHYLFAGAVGLVIVVSMFRKQYHTKRNYILLGIFVGCTLLAMIVVSQYSPSTFRQAFSFGADHWKGFGNWLLKTPRDMHVFEFIPGGMLLFAAAGLFMKKSPELQKIGNNFGMAWAYIGAMIVGCAYFSPQPWRGNPVDMRYFIDLIPLGAAATALTFEILTLTKSRKWLPWAFLVVLFSSNLLYFSYLKPNMNFTFRLGDYISEVVNDYPSTGRVVEKYIKDNIKDDECLLMVPLYNNIIQMYYNPNQKFCGISTNTAAFAKKHKAELREDLFWETSIPDYFMVGNRMPEKFQILLDQVYGEESYALDTALPVFWREATRPEIPWRSFDPIIPENPLYGGMLVFKRTDKPAHFPVISARNVERYLKY